ncbi:hypothetical protein L1S32_09685 [Methanogenium sp. S4BF]|uniref:hypothetical protein n=1 Tax=Methanogenium sp. S4BF TaxID=1789226 RepID=UPI002415D11B|nr:hypothetical protein [Methanogenium sp. S4BF]WFN34111.1 hypothetical protein L1S32_09685 [Methanogenium sp. S4BF]
MGVRYRSSLCISLALLLLFLLICVPSAAVIAEVTNGTLLESRNEGELIQYTMEVSGIPKQTRIIEMTTDLMPVPGTSLWQPEVSGFMVSGGDAALNDHKIELTEDGEFPDAINVTVSGRVPVLTSVEIVDGVVVTKRITQTTGYVYYRIQALDENRDILGSGTTETFSVKIPDDEQFTARLNAVTDPDLRALIDDLYSRGLRDEANDLLEYAEAPKESTLPVTMAILVSVVLLVGGFGAGMVFGQMRAKNMQEFQKEYKGD